MPGWGQECGHAARHGAFAASILAMPCLSQSLRTLFPPFSSAPVSWAVWLLSQCVLLGSNLNRSLGFISRKPSVPQRGPNTQTLGNGSGFELVTRHVSSLLACNRTNSENIFLPIDS